MKTLSHFQKSRRFALKTRLAAYSATAGAALAASGTANAGITNITSGMSLHFLNTALTTVPLDAGPFHAALRVANTADVYGYAAFARTAPGITGNADIAGLFGAVQNFAGGTNFTGLDWIHAGAGVGLFAKNFRTATGHGTSRSGTFAPQGAHAATTGYIALRAGAGATLKYGWLRVRVRNSASSMPATFSLIAKQGEPGVFGAWDLASDAAADEFQVGISAPVPEPSTLTLGGLGLLALGAAGVREMRRRRAELR